MFFHAPEELKVTLGVESSGPTKAWLNSAEVLSMCRYRPIRPRYAGHGDGYASVLLAEGWNELFVKLVRTEGALLPSATSSSARTAGCTTGFLDGTPGHGDGPATTRQPRERGQDGSLALLPLRTLQARSGQVPGSG
jgi:hypothetical protein